MILFSLTDPFLQLENLPCQLRPANQVNSHNEILQDDEQSNSNFLNELYCFSFYTISVIPLKLCSLFHVPKKTLPKSLKSFWLGHQCLPFVNTMDSFWLFTLHLTLLNHVILLTASSCISCCIILKSANVFSFFHHNILSFWCVLSVS